MLLIMLVFLFFFFVTVAFKEGGVYSDLQFEEMESAMVAEGTVVGD